MAAPLQSVFWLSLDGPDRSPHASDGLTTPPASYIDRLSQRLSFLVLPAKQRLVSVLFSFLSPKPSFPIRFQRSQSRVRFARWRRSRPTPTPTPTPSPSKR